MPRAKRINQDHIQNMTARENPLDFDLSHIHDTPRTGDENLYLVSIRKDDDEDLSFVAYWETEFNKTWRFVDPEDLKHFVKVESLLASGTTL